LTGSLKVTEDFTFITYH